ncbi:MAG: FlgD immunoglobulin-like domain containing protein [Bacteroidota bacterium]|jgi:hypothetical protein|nr:FlgD immunoglobulin-like domain containing protein [Bacteroidota bacterium]
MLLFAFVMLTSPWTGGVMITSAQPTMHVVVDRADVNPGDRVYARVVVTNFPPFRTHGIRIGYDRALLRCVSVQNTGFYEGYSTFFFRQIDSIGGKAGADEAILGPGWVNKNGAIIEMQFVALGSGTLYLPFLQSAVYDSGLAIIEPIVIDSMRVLGALAAPTLGTPAHMQGGIPLVAEFVWNPVDGASTYRIQVTRDSAFSFGVALDTVLSDTRLTARLSHFGTRHFWRVRAEAPSVTSSWSEVREFTTEERVLGIVRLLTPADGSLLDGTAPLAFTWEAVEGATAYEFDIQELQSGKTVYNKSVVGATELIVRDLVLRQETPYRWRVRAEADDGIGGWSDAREFQLRPAPPERIVLLAPNDAASVDPRNVRLQWEEEPNAGMYFVQVSTAADFSSLTWETSVSVTEAAPRDLITGTRYFWRVRGINGAGLGPWSLTRSFITDAQTSVHEPPLPEAGLAIGIPSPHPLRDPGTLQIHVPTGGRATVDVIDMSGSLVARLHDGYVEAGVHALQWSGSSSAGNPLPPGCYLLRLATHHGVATRVILTTR